MSAKIHDKEYLFITTRLRALETRLLDQGQMDQMLEAESVEDASRILADCGYPELETVSAPILGEMLTRERTAIFEDLGQLVPDPMILSAFQAQHDYHNVKVLLKSEAMGVDSGRLLVDSGRIPSQILANALQSGDMNELPDLLAEAITEARQVLATSRDPQLGDFTLDRYYFRELMGIAETAGSSFLMGYVQRTIDVANLRTLVRVLRMGKGTEFLERSLFPGGTMEDGRLLQGVSAGVLLEELYAASPLRQAAEAGTAAIRGGTLTQFEKLCDNSVIGFIRDAQYVSFGEAPVIAYLAAKEAEMMAIRIIMTGRLAGLSTDVIRERLREAYV